MAALGAEIAGGVRHQSPPKEAKVQQAIKWEREELKDEAVPGGRVNN